MCAHDQQLLNTFYLNNNVTYRPVMNITEFVLCPGWNLPLCPAGRKTTLIIDTTDNEVLATICEHLRVYNDTKRSLSSEYTHITIVGAVRSNSEV